ncbi:LysR family transcriptional regulator [Labrys sp. LIt4]|uniref:LysR family transcriptional regulator n=1 Tax=Labrys TaxID=204476 RepID=UPI001ADFB014|nr:LysR family transcriptional regulator [Labrys okinawensis]MBP0578810.1 LysR family transcriptional regulator [Labrys sp. LIt4]
MDRLNGVSVFVEAVEAGGFAAAAQRLNLSRSAVGKSIARLEERLGARLFHRTTRSQALTEDGQVFYERCLRALAEIREGEALLDSGRRDVSGRLRVTMPALFGRVCVAPLLLRLAAQHPALELELNFNDRRVDLIEEGYDLAIRNGTLESDMNLITRRVALQRMTVCAAPAYLREHGAPLTLAALADHQAILYGRSGHPRSWLFPVQSGPAIEIMPPSRFIFDSLDAVADAAVAGAGLAWMPCWLVAERVRRGELIRVLTEHPGLVFDVHALWPRAPVQPLRVRAAIDLLATNLSRLMSNEVGL